MREIAFGAVFSLLVALGAGLAAAWPVPGEPVASYFAPGTTATQASLAVVQAGGRLLQIDESGALVISIGNRPDYVTALYGAGALLVADAALARLCMSLSQQGRK